MKDDQRICETPHCGMPIPEDGDICEDCISEGKEVYITDEGYKVLFGYGHRPVAIG